MITAKERASTAERRIADAESELRPAQQRYAVTAGRANRAEVRAEAAANRADRAEASLVDRREAAAERVATAEARYEAAVERHDEDVEVGWGVALAALIAAGISLLWSRFRASTSVGKLADLPRGRAIGLCVGGGFAAVIVGAALGDAGGAIAAIGVCVLVLGIVVPVALLLARHAIEVERGNKRAVFRHERLPGWVAPVLAVLMALAFVGSLGSAISIDAPEKPLIPDEIRTEAEYAGNGRAAEPHTAELDRTLGRSERLEDQAVRLARPRTAARRALREIHSQLQDGRRQLARAESSIELYSSRLAAIAEREGREAEAAAAEEREIEELEEESELAPEGESYETCATAPSDIPVPPGSPLDGDGDGIGCES